MLEYVSHSCLPDNYHLYKHQTTQENRGIAYYRQYVMHAHVETLQGCKENNNNN